MSPRRTQQFDLYGAERRMPPALRGRRFDSQADIQKWVVTELLDAPWWGRAYPEVDYIDCPTVSRRGTSGSVGAYIAADKRAVIEMHPDHWYVQIVLHELAHPIADARGSIGHDPIFAKIYLDLVYRVLGYESWIALRTLFLEDGICFDERCQDDTTCRCGERKTS